MLALCIDPVGVLERKVYFIYQTRSVNGYLMVLVFTTSGKQINSTTYHRSWMAKRFKIIDRTPLIGV